MQARCLIKNAHLVSPGKDLPNASIEIVDGLIKAIYETGHHIAATDKVFDAKGALLVPGFIDIHTHGAAGHDFCDAKPESLWSIARAKLKEGVTTFLPTTLTLSEDLLEKTFQAGRTYFENQCFAKVAGVHVEGPFINPNCAGAQNPAHVRPPDLKEISRLQEILPIKIVSLAVEMPGGIEFVEGLSGTDTTASLAHTAASFDHFTAAKNAGATHLTHFCNQMTPLHHREIGLVGAGLLDDDILVEMICDKIHLCPEMIQLAFKVIGENRIMLITDSIAASGLPDNQRIQLGELDVTVENGVARLASGALAGSTLRMNSALKNIRAITQRPLSQLIGTSSYNQASSLGLEGLGKIEPGYTADLVVLDSEYQPKAVFVDGVERLGDLVPESESSSL